MSKLQKPELLLRIVEALKRSGTAVVIKSTDRAHPLLATILKGDKRINVRCYIWNVSHGGGVARPSDEYRVQITGVSNFDNAEGEITLVLGWWEEAQVFVGFDFRRHGKFGFSPSIQVRESVLRNSYENGMALYMRGSREVAVAFRSDFIWTYIDNWTDLHNPELTQNEFDLITSICRGESVVELVEASSVPVEPRKRILVATYKAVRENGFRNRILNAYMDRCAACGMQLELVEAAHILPVTAEGSTDETSNGIALCSLHHKALDNCLIDVADDFRLLYNDKYLADLKLRTRLDGLKDFQRLTRPYILLPADQTDRPSTHFLQKGRHARGWHV